MFDLVSLVLISAAIGIAALAAGFYFGRYTGTGAKAGEFEQQLNESQQELQDYREEVYQQFGETAKKFERLQETYTDLHAQLANSAEVLCAGKGVGPLLTGALATAAIAAPEEEAETVVEDLTESEEYPEESAEAEDIIVAEAADEPVEEEITEDETEIDMVAEESSDFEDEQPEVVAEEEIVLEEADELVADTVTEAAPDTADLETVAENPEMEASEVDALLSAQAEREAADADALNRQNAA